VTSRGAGGKLIVTPVPTLSEVHPVSIVRIGLAETKNFAEGYDAIFGGKKPAAKAKAAKPKAKKKTAPKKKK
jgi:hypothetical protein